MKLRFHGIISVLLCTLTLWSAPDDAQNFRNTVKHVDTNGYLFNYYSTTRLNDLVRQIPGVVEYFGDALAVKPHEKQLAKDGTELVLNILNMYQVKAIAFSERQIGDQLYIHKSFVYMGKDAALPGLFSTSGFSNNISPAAELASLPADTIFAAKFQVNTEMLIKHTMTSLNASPNAMLKSGNSMLLAFAAGFGIDINQFAAAVTGEYFIIIAGTGEHDLRAMVYIPDKNGVVAALLKKHFGNMIKDDVWQLPVNANTPDLLRPVIKIQPGKIVLISNEKYFAIRKPALQVPRQYLSNLPETGCSFAYIALTPDHIRELKKIEDKDIQKTVDALSPFTVIFAGKVERDGSKLHILSNFPLSGIGMYIQEFLAKVI